MSYRFDPFLALLAADRPADDELLQRLIGRYAPDVARTRIAEWGAVAGGRLLELAEESARPGNAPFLRRRDPFGRRVDDVVLPSSTQEALEIVHGRAGLGFVRGDPFEHYAMIYLLAQNGEAGIACSLACTDGLARALEALGDSEVHASALQELRASSAARYVHGAQFVTEIQGGSDVPANRMRALPEGSSYRLHGQKWFCSNIGADWFLVTARPLDAPQGGSGIGLFLVPAFVEEAGRRARNGYAIDRLKDKLGTRELPTAEVTFAGALAWPLGPVDSGLRNLLRYVLTPSRFACVLFAAAALRRAERTVSAYARFREAFGRPIADYPLVARTLEAIASARARTLACAFELLELWRRAERHDDGHPDAVDFRILLGLAKPALTRQCTLLLHESMMLLGGNGIEERFSPLPRLYRDGVIMETWEGPHNVLYTQALRDLLRFEVGAGELVRRLCGEDRAELVDALDGVLSAARQGEERSTVLLAALAPGLVAAVGERVLESAGAQPPGAPPAA